MNRPTHLMTLILLAAWPVAALASDAPPPAPPRAARSVHLHYSAPEASLFYNEATVEQSQRGSYFCAAGFGHGYFGIQEQANGRKVVIFSVWEPGTEQKPGEVPEDRRVEMLYQGDGVRIGRFGGEGTGGQSFLDYPWKTGETCRFLLQATVEGQKTSYAAWFFRNDTNRWAHIATFRTLANGDALKGFYSFVEDFRRDGKSPNEQRLAHYGNGWVRTSKGDSWVSLTRATFTGDKTPLNNVDAGVNDGSFYLATGGQTQSTRPLGSIVERPPTGVTLPDLTAPAEAKPAR